MKYLFLFILYVLCVSCSNPVSVSEKSFEQESFDSALVYFQGIAKNPESVQLSNPQIVLSCDSLCIIDFDVRAQNGYGGYNNERFEYVHFSYLNANNVRTVESTHYNLKRNKTLLEQVAVLKEEDTEQSEISLCITMAKMDTALKSAFKSPSGQRLFGKNNPEDAF